jgi:hypothetical protein
MSVHRLETSLDRVLRRRPNFAPPRVNQDMAKPLPPIPAREFARAPRIARLHPGWIVAVLFLAIVALARAGVTP